MSFKTEFRLILSNEKLPKYDIYGLNIEKFLKGEGFMEKIVAKNGYEDIFDVIKTNIDNLESRKDNEIYSATEEINKKYAEQLEKLNALLTEVSEIVELPDENEDSVSNEELSQEIEEPIE